MTALKQSTAQIVCHVDRASHALPCQLYFVFVLLQDSRGCFATHALSDLITGDHVSDRNQVNLELMHAQKSGVLLACSAASVQGQPAEESQVQLQSLRCQDSGFQNVHADRQFMGKGLLHGTAIVTGYYSIVCK